MCVGISVPILIHVVQKTYACITLLTVQILQNVLNVLNLVSINNTTSTSTCVSFKRIELILDYVKYVRYWQPLLQLFAPQLIGKHSTGNNLARVQDQIKFDTSDVREICSNKNYSPT